MRGCGRRHGSEGVQDSTPILNSDQGKECLPAGSSQTMRGCELVQARGSTGDPKTKSPRIQPFPSGLLPQSRALWLPGYVTMTGDIFYCHDVCGEHHLTSHSARDTPNNKDLSGRVCQWCPSGDTLPWRRTSTDVQGRMCHTEPSGFFSF